MLDISNILVLMNKKGEDKVKQILSTFISENNEVEDFIKNKAIDFAKRKWSITYLVSDCNTRELLGIFTLAAKAVQVDFSSELSNNVSRKIKEFSINHNKEESITSTAYLLAQFSKNQKFKNKVTGEELLKEAIKELEKVQIKVGGRLLWLECENNNREALKFYKRENFGFQQFNTRYDKESNVKYKQMIRVF